MAMRKIEKDDRMSEKRFRANFNVSIYDSEKEEYISVSERGLEEIAKIMNEQQSTIDKLREDIRATRTTIERLKKENTQLQKKIDWLCERYGYNGDGV